MTNNPYMIIFGKEPSNFINRLEESNKIINDFSGTNPPNYVYVITGLRGSGKTVLLSRVANYFSSLDDWIVVDPGPKNNLLENVASEIYETSRIKSLFLKKEFSFSFSGISFTLKGNEPVSSTNTLLKKMLDKIKKDNKKVLITIDEIDNSNDMKSFIQAYQSLLRLDYPVMLLMTGLYENISKLQEDKTLTFLYRAPKIYLSPLNISQIAYSYKTNFKISEQEALELAKMTKGYAYAYQVLGYLLFNNSKKSVDDKILADFDQYLSDYVYEKIYSELTAKEQEILKGFNDNENIKLSDLSDKTGIDTKTISVYRDRLIKCGLVTSPAYGMLSLTLPRFAHFLNTKF